MNIFVTDADPVISAKNLDDMRVNKMITESLQMLAVAMYRNGANASQVPYNLNGIAYSKDAHRHHPCTIWAGDNRANYTWLLEHTIALIKEWEMRTGKIQAGAKNIRLVDAWIPNIPDLPISPFVNCTTHHKHIDDVHEAYRLEMLHKWTTKKEKYSQTWYGSDVFPGWA